MGVSVTAKAATISAIGIMDENDSESLDLMRFCNAFLLSQILRCHIPSFYIIAKESEKCKPFLSIFKNFLTYLLYGLFLFAKYRIIYKLFILCLFF